MNIEELKKSIDKEGLSKTLISLSILLHTAAEEANKQEKTTRCLRKSLQSGKLEGNLIVLDFSEIDNLTNEEIGCHVKREFLKKVENEQKNER